MEKMEMKSTDEIENKNESNYIKGVSKEAPFFIHISLYGRSNICFGPL